MKEGKLKKDRDKDQLVGGRERRKQGKGRGYGCCQGEENNKCMGREIQGGNEMLPYKPPLILHLLLLA